MYIDDIREGTIQVHTAQWQIYLLVLTPATNYYIILMLLK